MKETNIKLPKPIFLIVESDFSPRLRKGMKVKVDELRSRLDCGSGIEMRVINIYKNPTWLDSGWFTC